MSNERRPWSEKQAAGRRASQARIAAGEGFIYMTEIVKTGKIKIGFSLNVEKRLGQLAKFDGPHTVLAVMPGSLQAEKALHRNLKPYRAPNGPYHWHAEIYEPAVFASDWMPHGLLRRMQEQGRAYLRPTIRMAEAA